MLRNRRWLVAAGLVALALVLAGCGGAGAGGGDPSGGDPGAGTPADTTPPADVASLSTAAGDESITLSWSDPPDSDLAEILITWDPDGAAAQTVTPGTESYTATGLLNDQAYTFTVVAVDSAGNVSGGVTATATPQEPNVDAPAEVSSLQSSPGDGRVTLTWTDPGDSDLDRVEIRWDPDGDTWQSVSAGTESYTATGLTNGRSYTFTLRTVDDAGNASAGVTITEETPFTGNVLTDLHQLGVQFEDYDSDSGWAVVVNIVGDQPDIASLMPVPDPNLGTLSGLRFVSFEIRKPGLTQELPTGSFPIRPNSETSGNAFSANFVLGLGLDFANNAYLGSDHGGSTSPEPFWSGQIWDYDIEDGQLEISRSGSNYTLDFSLDLDTGNTVTGTYSGPIDLLLEADPPDLTPPEAPTILGVSNGTVTRNNVTFSVGNIESGAWVQYSVNGGSSWSAYSGPVTLSSHGTYQITARQTDEAGNRSDNATTVNVTIDKEGPEPVGDLTATASIGEIQLTWDDPNDSDLDEIVVSWTPADAGGTATVANGVASYTRNGLKAGREYEFTVQARDQVGNLGPSRTVTATVFHPREVYFPGIDFFPLGDAASESMGADAAGYYFLYSLAEGFIRDLDRATEHWTEDSPETFTFEEGQTEWTVTWSYRPASLNPAFFFPARWCWEVSAPGEDYKVCITSESLEGEAVWAFDYYLDPPDTSPFFSASFFRDAILGTARFVTSGDHIDLFWRYLTDGANRYEARIETYQNDSVDEYILFNISQDGNDGDWALTDGEQTISGSW